VPARPAGCRLDDTISRRYIEPTMVLQNTFDTPTGTLTVTDTLATGASD
jgi:hypothetical protein